MWERTAFWEHPLNNNNITINFFTNYFSFAVIEFFHSFFFEEKRPILDLV
tara:strand:+ start:1624 stop:1773 length:150 start_codon:yes stop_codon:yes gene_type:complete